MTSNKTELEIVAVPILDDNYAYALVSGNDAAIVDPGQAAPIAAFLAGRHLRLTHVLLTHHHRDHVDGAAELTRSGDVAVFCSELDRARLPVATRGLKADETFTLFGREIRVIATPGHTLGHVAFYCATENAVFTGDTLFSAGCGRLFEGDAAQMWASLARLNALPPTTRVYFGHEYTVNNLEFVLSRATGARRDAATRARDAAHAVRRSGGFTTPTTIAAEREFNPFLTATSVTDFADWRGARDQW